MLNIDVWDIVWTVVNLLLFFVLLRVFLFKPVMKVMDEREQMIRDDIDSAQAAKEESEELRAKYETELAGAHDEALRIRSEAQESAAKEKAEIIAEAHAEAAELIADAKKTIEHDRREAIESAHDEIAGLAVLAASRVVSRIIDEDSNREYAEQILAEVGADND